MLRHDMTFALRNMIRRPAFALLVTATLGVGIGVNTAMFTVVNSVLIQPLPYKHAERLVYMYGSFSKYDRASISPPDFLDYRAANTVFESFAAQRYPGSAAITGSGGAERVSATDVTANYFTTLGVAPLRGRAFATAEEEGAASVAIISYGLWQRRFGGDASILDKALTIDGRPHRIIGVMPPILDRTLSVDVWRPLQLHGPAMAIRRFHFLRAIGRLKPGVTVQQAQASMDVVAKRLEATYPENATWHLNLLPYREVIVGNIGRALMFLLVAVGLVLLIACGNVASLLLARATTRQAEIAIRTALGASRKRLVQQLVTESLMLAIAGGAAGFVLATWLVHTLRAVGTGILPRLAEVSIDGTVLGFTMALSLVTGLLFGVAPALHAARDDLARSLASIGRTSGSRATVRARDLLVIAQVALSLVLLAGAGLLVRSLWNLQHVSPGFDARHVLASEIFLPEERYADRAAQQQFWERLVADTRALPGVQSASLTSMLPLRGGGDTRFWIEGQDRTPERAQAAQINVVADDYFSTMRIPIVRGRALGREDRTGPNTLLISETMAQRIFPGTDPIGRRLVVDFGKNPFIGDIVGVVGNVSAFGVDATPPDVFYFSIHQSGGFGRGFMNLVVRTEGDPSAAASPIRAALAAIDKDIPLAGLRTMEEIVADSMSRQRFTTRLLIGFAFAAALLAVVGLYGVLAFVVGQRTRELGVRIALGASRRRVFVLVVARGMKIVSAGIALGLIGALLTTRLVTNLLFEVKANDPIVLASVTGALALAALLACVLPARQATRVDPISALRSEA
jgi:putative ABC transport system permease protein